MKYFLVLAAAVLAVAAVPTHFDGDYDPARHPGAYTSNTNYTTERIPWGQAGFASMHGGTNGGNGGAQWSVWDVWALRDAVNGNARREVLVHGFIDFTPMFTGSPGVRFNVGSYKSIIGMGRYATLFGGGLVVSGSRQVIFHNVRFHNALNYAPGERPNGNGGIVSFVPGDFSTIDALGIDRNAEFVWVNHCDFADDPWIWNSGPRRHDGLLDITRGASMISISNCFFRNHNFVSLVGNNDNLANEDRGRLKTTWYLNWFHGVNQRMPRVRFGEVHVVNNLYTYVDFYAVGVGHEAQVFVERNSFINTRFAWRSQGNGRMADYHNRRVNSAVDNSVNTGGTNWHPAAYYAFFPMDPYQTERHVRIYAGTH